MCPQSVYQGRSGFICSLRVFRILTHTGISARIRFPKNFRLSPGAPSRRATTLYPLRAGSAVAAVRDRKVHVFIDQLRTKHVEGLEACYGIGWPLRGNSYK